MNTRYFIKQDIFGPVFRPTFEYPTVQQWDMFGPFQYHTCLVFRQLLYQYSMTNLTRAVKSVSVSLAFFISPFPFIAQFLIEQYQYFEARMLRQTTHSEGHLPIQRVFQYQKGLEVKWWKQVGMCNGLDTFQILGFKVVRLMVYLCIFDPVFEQSLKNWTIVSRIRMVILVM